MRGAVRVARRLETERRGGRCRQAYAGVAFRRPSGVERTCLLALGEIFAIVLKAHGFGLGEASQHDAADLARVAVTVGIEGPAPLPGGDPHGERLRLGGW